MEPTITFDSITGEHQAYVRKDGIFIRIAVFPSTKRKAFDERWPALERICETTTDSELIRAKCQDIVDSAPAVPSGHISAHVPDPLTRLRAGSPLGDLLERNAHGDGSAFDAFPRELARQTMFWTLGNHIVRIASVMGEGLGSGVLIILPPEDAKPRPQIAAPYLESTYAYVMHEDAGDRRRHTLVRCYPAKAWMDCAQRAPRRGRWAIMTCSHVWAHVIKHEKVQIYCACSPNGFGIDERIVEVAVNDLFTLDLMDDRFLNEAGFDALSLKRDSAIIVGNLHAALPPGVRAFNLLEATELQPDIEKYALVGYPLFARGEFGAQFLEHVGGNGKDKHFFVSSDDDEPIRSWKCASGGLLVAIRGASYRPAALMVAEVGSVAEARADSRNRVEEPSRFMGLPFFELRAMVQRARKQHFRDRHGRTVPELE